jgi:hypothetical protein
MDLPTTEMAQAEAAAGERLYRKMIESPKYAASHADAETWRAYRELAKGHPLITLTAAMEYSGGDPDTGRPMLAISRADQLLVHCRIRNDDGQFSMGARTPRYHLISEKQGLGWTFGKGILDPPSQWEGVSNWGEQRLRAVVPIIPPQHRPSSHLRNWHILFEADWAVDTDRPPVPYDPALLKWLGGDLYAVHAIWDLTEPERLALGLANRE